MRPTTVRCTTWAARSFRCWWGPGRRTSPTSPTTRCRAQPNEIAARERTRYPPFGRLASLVISGPDRPSAEGFARRLASAAPPEEVVRVLGPAEAPITVIRGRHRFRLLAKAEKSFDLSGYLRGWLRRAPKVEAGVRLEVDIDPVSFL